MPDINSLTQRLKDYLTDEQINKVRRAYYYAEQAHDGQKRRSGESYITHPLAVAAILSEMRMDHQGLMAAMLHDVIEDSEITKDTIARQFGQTVADIVDGVSKLAHIRFENKAQAQAENFQKMSLALAKDIRVILVKLADRLHNMRTLSAMPPYKRRLKVKETLEIYSPIAQRLGMHSLRVEFEELSFKAMHPMRAHLLSKAVRRVRGKRAEIINRVVDNLSNALKKKEIPALVTGREKHLYSIYCKMKLQKKSFSEIMDVLGIRIITRNIDDCYRILGIIHNVYKPFPGRFKDYVAIPKANGYQSLHTILFGSRAIPVEIQIRTQSMDDMAKNGIASHWLYKKNNDALTDSLGHSRDWIENLLELQQKSTNSLEFIENVKKDLFPDEVFVFTPQGEIFELPRGSTVVDFAYAVHTQVGDTCVACRIDKRLASISQQLESGQTIEIITASNAHPNSTWLDFAITSKARSNIRHYLNQKSRTEFIHLGRHLLNKVLSKMVPGSDHIDHLSESALGSLLLEMKFSNKEDLLESIGLGKSMSYIAASHIITLINQKKTQKNSSVPEAGKLLCITGKEESVINFSACCYPVPGDPIIGYLMSGKGITIHRQTCLKAIENRDKGEMLSEVGWSEGIIQGSFRVRLSLSIDHRKSLFTSIFTVITSAAAEIEKFEIIQADGHTQHAILLILIKDRVHLARVFRRVRHIPGVLSISRQQPF